MLRSGDTPVTYCSVQSQQIPPFPLNVLSRPLERWETTISPACHPRVISRFDLLPTYWPITLTLLDKSPSALQWNKQPICARGGLYSEIIMGNRLFGCCLMKQVQWCATETATSLTICDRRDGIKSRQYAKKKITPANMTTGSLCAISGGVIWVMVHTWWHSFNADGMRAGVEHPSDVS